MSSKADFESLRSLGFAGISGVFASVGGPTENPIRAFRLLNLTDADMYFTNDVTMSKWYVPAGSFVLYDVQSNINKKDDKSVFAIGTQFSVKEVTAPSSGLVCVECLYQR